MSNFLVFDGKTYDLVERATPTPVVAPTVAPRVVSVYLMRGQGRSTEIPSGVNEVRIAFAQGDPPTLVEWGGESTPVMATGLTEWRTRVGGKILVSVGGQDGHIAINGSSFVDGIKRIDSVVRVDGIDFDVEAASLNVDATVAAVKALNAWRPGMRYTFTPPGGPPVALFLEAAKKCVDLGVDVKFSQQLYGAPVTVDQAVQATGRAVDVLGESRVMVAMMIGADRTTWTIGTCQAVMVAIKKKYPNIGGFVLWESKRPYTSDWVKLAAMA